MNYEKSNHYPTSFEYCLISHPFVKLLLILHTQKVGRLYVTEERSLDGEPKDLGS